MKNIKLQSGVTLLELMVVLVIVGILAAIAIPAYQQNVVTKGRAEAMAQLLEIRTALQSYSASNPNYAYTTSLKGDLGYSSDPVITPGGRYSISAGACKDGSDIEDCVLLTATPVAGREQVGDGDITIDTKGNRTHNNKTGWPL